MSTKQEAAYPLEIQPLSPAFNQTAKDVIKAVEKYYESVKAKKNPPRELRLHAEDYNSLVRATNKATINGHKGAISYRGMVLEPYT